MGYLNIADVEKISGEKEDLWYSKMVQASKDFIKELQWDEKNLFYHIVSFLDYISIVYFDGIFICNIYPLESVEEMLPFKKQFLNFHRKYHRAYENGSYSDIEMYTDRKFKALIYDVFYEKMNEQQRFYEFIDVHKNCENTSFILSLIRLKEILSYRPKELFESRRDNNLIDDQGYINVFRGLGKTENDNYNAISWSTDIDAVKKFTYRFGSDEGLVRGKVHISNIAFIYDEEHEDNYRDYEKEVLVVPNSVVDIKRVQ